MDTWLDIGQKYLDSLLESMPRRIGEVVKLGAIVMKYWNEILVSSDWNRCRCRIIFIHGTETFLLVQENSVGQLMALFVERSCGVHWLE